MARVKICGINSPAAMDAACDAGADWIGFVFAPGSPRTVTPATAEALSGRRRGGPLRVGLFVAPDDDAIEAALEAVPLDVLQLYADPARAAEVRATFGVTVWRSIGVAARGDLPTGAEPIDGYVLDAAPPEGATMPGGNAGRFDHALLRGWSAPQPWLLAGGLTVATLAAAIAESGAEAVDVSSGVELTRGIKDPALIAAFIDCAHAQAGRRG